MRCSPFALSSVDNCSQQRTKRRRLSEATSHPPLTWSQSQGSHNPRVSWKRGCAKRYHEVEMTLSGHSRDVPMDKTAPSSKWKKKLRSIWFSAEAKEGLHRKAGSGKLLRSNALSRQDKLVADAAGGVAERKEEC